MKLGEIQLKWIKELEEHPERQISGYLGRIGERNSNNKVFCELCCLGQAVVVLENIDVNTYEGAVFSELSTEHLSEKHKELLGLRDSNGKVNQKVLPDNHIFKDSVWDCLITINDYYDDENKPTWILIAETMKEYPTWAFKESK